MSLRVLSLVVGALAAGLAGCGGGGGGSTSTPAPSGNSGTPKPEDFPKGSGLTFQDLQSKYPAQLSLGIGASVMRQGPNRIPFVVLDKGARPVLNAAGALYTVHQDGTDVRGPFVAKETQFDVKPEFLAKTSASDSATAKVFYTAQLPFKGKAPQGVFALVRMDGRLVAASPSPLGVKSRQAPPPDVGDKAISIHTETVADGKKLSYLTTRVPPDKDMVSTDFADVLGKKPIVLQFATPALCQSRVCGPVVDVAEQVRSELGDKAAFIHQEIYANNQPNKGLRPQLAKWRLESEPWTFVIDRSGTITARFEGAVSVPELKAAVEKVL
jgi:hypothetical protein